MFNVVFLNLGPPSKVSIKEANFDINAILETQPTALLGCEGFAKGKLPNGEKMGMVKVRDLSTAGRANIYAYIREEELPNFSWEDMAVPFDREPGRPGKHPPRAYVRFNFSRVQWTVAHHPPGWPGTTAARAEHLNRLRHDFAPWTNNEHWRDLGAAAREVARNRSRALFWDRNMTMPAFRKFAESCDAWPVGDKIDCMMGRNLTVIDQGYQRKFDGHNVHTDHPWGAFHVRFKIGARK